MTEQFEFTDAVREAIPALIAISGPSGSGKTYTALQLATGLADGGPIFGIDTENNRMKLYASDFRFKHLSLNAPFDPERYVAAINAAVKAGAKAIVVDSATPEWDGAGGVQEIVDQAMVRFKNNKFAAWGVGTPKHQAFLDALTHCPVHLVVTVRAKMAYEQVDKTIKKLGLQPIQRPGFEYEFPFWFDVDASHQVVVSRSCWAALSDQVYTKPGPELGRKIAEWLDSGEAPVDLPKAPVEQQPAGRPAPTATRVAAAGSDSTLVSAIQRTAPDHPKVKDGSVAHMSPKQLEALAKSVNVDLAAPEAPQPERGEPVSPAGPAPDWSDHWAELAQSNAMWPAELEATLQGTPEGKDLTLATLDPESEAGRKLAAALKAKGAA